MVWNADAIVLIHLSRRTNLLESKRRVVEMLGAEQDERVHFLMDHRTNRQRYEEQLREAEAQVRAEEPAPSETTQSSK